MFRIFGSAAPRLVGAIVLVGFGALTAGAGEARAQASDYVFPASSALVLHIIKADKTSEWEGIMQKVKEGLRASENPQRKAQAESWKIFKGSAAGPEKSVMYFWRIDGAPNDADFSMVKLMQEL